MAERGERLSVTGELIKQPRQAGSSQSRGGCPQDAMIAWLRRCFMDVEEEVRLDSLWRRLCCCFATAIANDEQLCALGRRFASAILCRILGQQGSDFGLSYSVGPTLRLVRRQHVFSEDDWIIAPAVHAVAAKIVKPQPWWIAAIFPRGFVLACEDISLEPPDSLLDPGPGRRCPLLGRQHAADVRALRGARGQEQCGRPNWIW